MLARCFLKIITFSIISFIFCILGVGIAYYIQGPEIAGQLFESYIFNFDGILIIGFGYGLLWFIKSTKAQICNSLLNILEISQDCQISILRYQKWIISPIRNHLMSILVTTIGGTILWNCGYPLYGFSKYFLAATSISMFYIAGQMSGYFIGTILIFRKLDELRPDIKIINNASPYEIDNLNMHLLLCSTLGVIALYLAFRGTITANYTFNYNGLLFRRLLVYPIISFLPGILFANFYCRYVLRKLQENEILQKIESLHELSKIEIDKIDDNKQKLEIEKLFIEIKEKLVVEKNKIPLLGLKDSPALFVSVIFIIEFAAKNDDVINTFFKNLFK